MRRTIRARSFPGLAILLLASVLIGLMAPADAATPTGPLQTASARAASTPAAGSASSSSTSPSKADVSGIHSAAPRPASSGVGTPAAHPSTAPAGSARPSSFTPGLQISQSFCVPDTSTAAGLQNAFNVRGPVWGGGDGAQPVAIDAGRTVWLFGDTYIGGGPLFGPLSTTGLVHNSLVVQYDGNCFAVLLGNDGANWQSALPNPNSTDWYWPDDGTYDPATGVLSIVAMHMRVTTGGQFGWTELGVDVLHYLVEPTFSLLNIQNLFTYGDHDVAQFGQSIMTYGGMTYLYACAQSGPPACYLGRTDLELDPATLQFSTGSSWSSSMADAAPLAVDQLTGTELHVTAVDDGYLATNQIPLLSTTTNAWWSASPTGPFVAVGALMQEDQPPLGPIPGNWFTYGGRTINTSAGTIGVYSVNTGDDEAATVAGIYGPRFVSLSSNVLDWTPYGLLDASSTTRSGGAEVTGWAIDPDTTASIAVRFTVDGATSTQAQASNFRADVASAFPAMGGFHGFDAVVPLAPGLHQVCAYALNVIGGAGNPPLGCVTGMGTGVPSRFVPVTPTRLLDSRDGTGGYTTPWGPGQTRTLRVAGVGPVPAGATAVVLNLAATNTTTAGFVTAAPAGGLLPTASNLNFWGGETIANLVTVGVGTGGSIALFNGSARADLVADVVGYYTTTGGSGYTPVTPNRVLDSRDGTGGYSTPWAPGETRALTVAGVGSVPAGATAVVLNLTVTDATLGGYVTAWPTGADQPGTSNIDFSPGQVIPNLVTVPVGAGGTIDLYNRYGQVDLVADVVGYYGPASSGALATVGPVRVLDSRYGTGGYSTPWGPGQTRSLVLAGSDGVPANATAVVLNLTATDASLGGYVTAWPAGTPQPTASNLNFGPGVVVPNLVVVKLSAGGVVDLFNRFGQVDLVADLVGFFAPS